MLETIAPDRQDLVARLVNALDPADIVRPLVLKTCAALADDLDNDAIVERLIEAAEMLTRSVQPCPECAAGKHVNCDGITWDTDKDCEAVCPCSEAGHS